MYCIIERKKTLRSCYNISMQPNNYWQPTEEEKAPTEMYQPQPVAEDTPVVSAPRPVFEHGDNEPIHWQADDLTYTQKSFFWYVMFGIVSLGLVALDVLLIKSYTFSLLVVVVAISVVVYTRRPPRKINYALSISQGIYIDEVLHHFNEYKAFGIVDSGDHVYLAVVPIKRFAPSLVVYFPQDMGEQIVDIFGARLPMHEMKADWIDWLLRKINL
jgi:hypothetical protein